MCTITQITISNYLIYTLVNSTFKKDDWDLLEIKSDLKECLVNLVNKYYYSGVDGIW